MLRLKEIDVHSEHYAWAERLLESSFPKSERRDVENQRQICEQNQNFHWELVCDDETPVGILTWWDFGMFRYAEHFAIDSTIRNKGYGRESFELFIKSSSLPIVLEVEKPNDEMSMRRIEFYKRLGFQLHSDFEYAQPPYRQGDDFTSMFLMSYALPISTTPSTLHVELNELRKVIYKEAYGVSTP